MNEVVCAFSDDGHNLFMRGLDLWQPVVDEFLAKHGFTMPGRMTAPAATGFAKIDDAQAEYDDATEAI